MGRPRRDRQSLSRERVIDAAAALFRERGYDKTSLKVIGERLGVSSAALYYHFHSKDEILFAYLEGGFDAITQATSASMDATDPVERMRQLIRTYALFDLGAMPGSELYTPGVFGYLQLAESLDAGQQKRLAKAQRSYLDLIRTTINEGIAAGVFVTEDVTAAAFALAGMVAHTLHWVRVGGKLSPTDIADLYAEYAIRMLSPAR